jgi:hypothetical protein
MIPLTEDAKAPPADFHPTVAMAANIDATSSTAEYARYIHQTLCSPTAATLLLALTRSTELKTIPGLTTTLIHNHLPKSTATDKGHMRRHRANTASTRNNHPAIVLARAEVDNMFPTHEACAVHDMFCFAALADATAGTMYTDITGAFPVRSFKNMQYIFVAYIYDLNAIIVRPMPSRTDASFIAAFTEVFKILQARQYQPVLNVMDNECSKAVETHIKKNRMKIQLVPPHNHRVNAAERAIGTFKEHFVAALATVDMLCPLQLWDEFLPQVELTLNLLRFSRRNPNISANHELYGPFDFSKTPLAPLGTKALIYDDPASRASWAPHATDGFYVGPASDHYRCLRFYIPATRRFRFADTWRLYPSHCQVPVLSEDDKTLQAVGDIFEMLGGTVPTTASAKIKHLAAITQLSAIMAREPNAPSLVNTAPRVGTATPPRVAIVAPPRVATTSNTITAPSTVRRMPLIHQRVTRNNNPFQILADTDDDNDDDDTVVHSNCSPRAPLPDLLEPLLPTTNHTPTPCPPAERPGVFQQASPPLIPMPTNGPPRNTSAVTIHDIRPGRRRQAPPCAMPTPHRYTIIEPDTAPTDRPATQVPSPPRRSTRIIQPRMPGNISLQAMHHVMTLEAIKVATDTQWKNPIIEIEELCCGVVHPITKETITQYKKLQHDPNLKVIWVPAMSKEIHRLAQGKEGITKGTNTIFFLSHKEIRLIPADRIVTYARIVIDHRPQKDDPNRVRITVGGNLINYPFELTTRTTDMVSSKILWNSTISTKGARFAGADIKNMYLETPLDRYEYMKMPLSLFPEDIIEHYNLRNKALNGYVYMEIRKGMYGLPQAGILANKLLKKRLARHGYFEQPHTPGLWKHDSRPVWFNLAVDDFGIKYIGDNNLQHLYDALRKETYEIVEDRVGDLYCGINLKWNYTKNYVDLDMSKYVMKQMTRYAHPAPLKPQHCPYSPNPISYGKDNQAPTPTDDSPLLDAAGKKRIQQIVGSFLYYARAVDPTILMALSDIATQSSAPTVNTKKRVDQFLDYMWTHPDAKIRYRASDMILNVHSDASYLSAPRARSRAGGYFFLGSVPVDGDPIKLNGAIHITCTILKLVAASAAEAELGALFLNAQEAKILRLTLHELGHPQPPTPIHIDNTTTVGIVNNTIKRQRSRAMEMRYFWLLDGKTQKYFKFYYMPGQENLGDYPSKHHTADIHQHVRPYYVHTETSPTILPRALKPSIRRGCAEILGDPYAKKSPLPRIGPITCLPVAPSIPSHRILGQSRLLHRQSLLHTSTRREPLE